MSRALPPDSAQGSKSAKSRVLQAASKLFAAHGFRGTSVRQIANRAKVNEVTVFRLFSSKRALYKEVLDSKFKKARPLWVPSEVTANEDERIFGTLARDLQRAFDPEFIRLLFFAALENREDMRKSVSPSMDQFFNSLADYLQQHMNTGAIRDADPRLVAKALVALVVYDRFSSDFLTGQTVSSDKLQTQTASLLEIWLHGVAR
jgi:AcrR family transcriptional regulator